MKRLVLLVLVMAIVALPVLAGGGKSCDRSKDVKAVELTGTIEGTDDARVFRVADSDKSYTICHESKADLAKLGGAKVRVNAKLVSCGGGQELLIEKADKI